MFPIYVQQFRKMYYMSQLYRNVKNANSNIRVYTNLGQNKRKRQWMAENLCLWNSISMTKVTSFGTTSNEKNVV